MKIKIFKTTFANGKIYYDFEETQIKSAVLLGTLSRERKTEYQDIEIDDTKWKEESEISKHSDHKLEMRKLVRRNKKDKGVWFCVDCNKVIAEQSYI